MKGFLPRDVDLSRRLEDTFGWAEFEEAICEIIKWLIKNEDYKAAPIELQPDSKWLIPFTIDSIEGISHKRFAQLCAAGWIENNWDISGTFEVSDELIERIQEKQCAMWRKTPPEISGFYWLRGLRQDETVVVRVGYDDLDNEFYAIDEDHVFNVDEKPDFIWYGPLKEPK